MNVSPEALKELKELYFGQGEKLFALCFLYSGRGGEAGTIMERALLDMAYNVLRGKGPRDAEEFWRTSLKMCQEYYVQNPRGASRKRKKKKESRPGYARFELPFSMTDTLRGILALRTKYKAPLFFFYNWGHSAEQAARVLNTSVPRGEKVAENALKKLDVSKEAVIYALSTVKIGEDFLQQVWDGVLTEFGEKGFVGKQRLRRFKRWMDSAVIYLAILLLLLCVLAFLGVEFGWFTGERFWRSSQIAQGSIRTLPSYLWK